MRRELRIGNRKLVLSEAEGSKMRNRFEGFTLTEVIMASALLIIALVPILRALTTSHVTSTLVEQRTRGLVLAQGKLDRIRAQSVYDYASTYTETNSVLDGSYLCNVTDSAVTSDLRQITVEVGYDLSGNSVLEAGEVEVTLTTLIAKRW